MIQLDTRVVPGHPEFWDRVHDSAPKFFEAAKALEPYLNEIFSAGPSEPLHKVCRHIAKTVCNSLGAVLVLTCNGYGNDAMKVARSMFEGAVTVGYLKLHPEQLQDYMDFVWLSSHKLIQFLRDHSQETLKDIADEDLAHSEQEYQRVAPRFTNRGGKVRSHWCKRPFSQMVVDVGLAPWYPSFYHLASAMHHVDMRGLATQLERNPDPEVLDADIAPSDEWIKQALLAAHVSVLFALEQYIHMASPEKKGLIEKALEGLQSAWSPPPDTHLQP